MSSIFAHKISWHYLPAEIRISILEALLQHGCSLAGYATVSPEWQIIIERYNFARITLTWSRLAEFNSFLCRNRSLVRYIWLCLELEEYDCTGCSPDDAETWGVSNTDNTRITKAFSDLFSGLSTWEPNGTLLLDISVHSPSDSEHWFNYLTFRPDIPSNKTDWDPYDEDQAMPVNADGHQHSPLTSHAISKVFDEIMGEGPFDTDEQENQWWQQLPLVPAVTGVLLRQQTRRRWKPVALAHMFARLPGLQEIHYEPWREWYDIQQQWTDQYFQTLFHSLIALGRLRRLILFENFHPQYPMSFGARGLDYDPIRVSTFPVCRAVANASLQLEHLSASFLVDASYFFLALKPAWEWPNLTSLALTSRLLAPDESPIETDDMLTAAAAAAVRMPCLEILEMWNAQKGLAMLFRYQSVRGERSAVITCRGTWEFALRLPVTQAWEAVTLKRCGCRPAIVTEVLDIGADVKSHGDAIHRLKLSTEVIRPVSLQQIRMEHRYN